MKDDELICRCEEITQAEIKEAMKFGLKTMTEVKRFTRAGMGLCQGMTCGRLVMGILARGTNQPLSEVRPCTSRPPVRPVPVSVLANRVTDDDQN
jgi:NAD(P)H-nitrite reductase large subunit